MQATPLANGTVTPTEWTTIKWSKVYRQVRNLRQRIFRATQRGDHKRVRSLQKLMLRSYANTLLSVRQVTQLNAGRSTAGIDRIVALTPAARGQLVDQLSTTQPWRAKPVRRVYIPKGKDRLRPLGIPTILDRCLQTKVKNALEPYGEAKFEGSSYGFRPGRGCHDALARVYPLACPNKKKQWVVKLDLKGAFDHLSHPYLLHALGPCPGKGLIKQRLTAGYLEQGVVHEPPHRSTSGGRAQPLALECGAPWPGSGPGGQV
jgi:RNA-directed DNA polymerase